LVCIDSFCTPYGCGSPIRSPERIWILKALYLPIWTALLPYFVGP
jgi:hypothetical protein